VTYVHSFPFSAPTSRRRRRRRPSVVLVGISTSGQPRRCSCRIPLGRLYSGTSTPSPLTTTVYNVNSNKNPERELRRWIILVSRAHPSADSFTFCLTVVASGTIRPVRVCGSVAVVSRPTEFLHTAHKPLYDARHINLALSVCIYVIKKKMYGKCSFYRPWFTFNVQMKTDRGAKYFLI